MTTNDIPGLEEAYRLFRHFVLTGESGGASMTLPIEKAIKYTLAGQQATKSPYRDPEQPEWFNDMIQKQQPPFFGEPTKGDFIDGRPDDEEKFLKPGSGYSLGHTYILTQAMVDVGEIITPQLICKIANQCIDAGFSSEKESYAATQALIFLKEHLARRGLLRGAVPEGFVLLPVEPDILMLMRMVDVYADPKSQPAPMNAVYKAMIQAAKPAEV